ncbi:TonB-dependent receptor [Flavobacterium agricola]|uniref:TonB-dependent receptor n=1 Tax=Flavobacterium agricola TaxID=2870839 RepID=A0ABY6LZM5_9FLAO|nr:TonB-dependent receptor [Flavobacterium agricola]UYW00864.1 TonB-dependent receptor [Flavobacterium agricola]
MKRIYILCCVLLFVGAHAQQKDTINDNYLHEIIIEKFIVKNSDYSNKMPLKAIENPQVYSSIDKQVLENQSIFTIDEAYRNVTGLQKMWGATNRAGDGGSYVSLRGFTTNNSLRNGLIGPVSTTIDAVNIEKIEVLKGPSATLFGSAASSYGGVVNRVTKTPYDSLGGNVSVSGGSYNFYRAQADINTPLTKDKRLLFRLNTAYTTEGTFQMKNANNRSFAFTPVVTYKVNDKLDLKFEYELFKTKSTAETAFFYLSKATTGVTNMKDLASLGLDYKQSYMGKGLYTDATVSNLFAQGTYKINNHIKSSTHVNTSYSKSDGYGPYFSLSLNPADNLLYVNRADQSTDNSKKEYFQVQQNFNFDYRFGEMRNRTVVGFDYMAVKDRIRYIYLENGNFDAVPASGYSDYGNFNKNSLAEAYAKGPVSTYNQLGNTDVISGYISNVFTPLPGFNIMAGVRYEHNHFKGGSLWVNELPAYKQASWSPKLGLVYELVKNRFSVFGNYQNSFKSNGYYYSDAEGNSSLADPEKANQVEGGFKTNLFRGRLNASLSYYNIDVKNTLYILGYIPETFNAYQDQSGKLNSQGVELEVNAYLLKGFSFIGGISYNHSKFIKADPTVQGRRPYTAGSPWLANFNASYEFLEGNLKGLGFGIGGNYASNNRILNQWDTTTNTENIFTLPNYFILNANAYYDAKKFRIAVKVDNLTNEKYWVGFSTANPQKLLNATATLTYKF